MRALLDETLSFSETVSSASTMLRNFILRVSSSLTNSSVWWLI